MEVEVLDLTASKCKTILNKYLITIIGVFIIIIAIINQSLSIVQVEFSDPDTYNEEVLSYLDKYYKKVGPFYYLNAKLTDINFDLRSEFYQYEWIGIRKQGSILYLDIKKIVNPPLVDETTPGSFYASFDGIVKKYHIEKGVVVVQEEQYVTKGELLISGDVIHYGNSVESLRAKGYVIAEVLGYYDFTIKKVETEKVRTGKLEIKKHYQIFQKLGRFKTTFSEYEVETNLDFEIPKLFSRYTNYIYETKVVKTIYTEDCAINYAKSMVEKEFRKTKINEFEKIIYNNLVKIEEDKDYYYIRLIVKSYRNIAKFYPKN